MVALCLFLESSPKGNFLNKFRDNIFKLFLIEWTKAIKAGGDPAVKSFSAKKRKLNYTVHNPNTVEDTAKMLLDVFVQANQKKVERKLQELADYNAICGLNEEDADVKEMVGFL